MGSGRFIEVFTTLPCCFFITAFSVLALVFASTYHTILKFGVDGHRCFHRFFKTVVLLLNLVSYGLMVLSYVMYNPDDHPKEDHMRFYDQLAVWGVSLAAVSARKRARAREGPGSAQASKQAQNVRVHTMNA